MVHERNFTEHGFCATAQMLAKNDFTLAVNLLRMLLTHKILQMFLVLA